MTRIIKASRECSCSSPRRLHRARVVVVVPIATPRPRSRRTTARRIVVDVPVGVSIVPARASTAPRRPRPARRVPIPRASRRSRRANIPLARAATREDADDVVVGISRARGVEARRRRRGVSRVVGSPASEGSRANASAVCLNPTRCVLCVRGSSDFS